MTDEELAFLAAQTSLKKMLNSGSFCIVDMRMIAKALRREPDPAADRILQPLHCVKYADMPAPLRAALPELIGRYLQIEWPPAGWDQPAMQSSHVAQPATPTGLMRLLGRAGG